MYDHILIPTDGSEVARRGVDQALALAVALKSRITVVTALEPLATAAYSEGWLSDPEAYQRSETARSLAAQGVLDEIMSIANATGIRADAVLAADLTPAAAILETAASRACDLIVMSSHGRRGIRKALLGSQTAEVLAHSPIPVLVIR